MQEPSDGGLPETIELEGKTVAAFYYNPGVGEFDDYLPSLQLMGGFLLALPEEEAPAPREPSLMDKIKSFIKGGGEPEEDNTWC